MMAADEANNNTWQPMMAANDPVIAADEANNHTWQPMMAAHDGSQ